LILLYWDIGRGIVEKQQALGWGESVIDRLASDLRAAFPESTGFSPRSLRDMKRFYLLYSDDAFWRQAVAKMTSSGLGSPIWPQLVAKLEGLDSEPEILRQLVAEIPWDHHRLMMNKLGDPAACLYYLRATAQLGWSRNVLLNQIKAGAYERAAKEKKTHNFALALPEHFAEQADEMMKSRYNLESLGIGRAVKERKLENRLVERLQQFILELGYGFCFIGRQYRLTLGGKEYFVDLLFYHRMLKALVAFDLKVGPFEPEHAGKMDFYLNLLNDKERVPGDQPSIGVILCAEKDDVEVEYALKTKTNPIGVAEYHLSPRLPAEYKGRLPTARQLADAVRDVIAPEK
jgi:predicted nuclease of restriction endonuclease-like (RecB) superfamily